MNKDFEFKQLIRAYRKGIISEETLEQEIATIENGVSANGPGPAKEVAPKNERSPRPFAQG